MFELRRLMSGIKKFLFTNILCPWGYTKYIHMVGNLQMDIVIQSFLMKALLAMSNDHEKFRFVNLFREDYINDTKYQSWLFNDEEWTPRTSIEFVTWVVPVIITCQKHSGGTENIYPFSKVTQPFSSF